jgi:hypothetical protein
MSASGTDNFAVHQVGLHQALIELPDILHIHYQGDVSLEEFKIFDAFVANFPGSGFLYVLRDARRGGETSLETRAYMARAAQIERLRAVVSYGSTFYARMLVDMSSRAIRSIRSLKKRSPETAFFSSEEEARAWIVRDRASISCRFSTDGIGFEACSTARDPAPVREDEQSATHADERVGSPHS